MFFPIIVTYNKSCVDSPTCEAVRKAHLRGIVCDNSTGDFCNREYCDENGFDYISMNGNKGLSRAYNAAIEFLSGKEGFAVILDDDTQLPEDFFEKMEAAAVRNPDAKLLLPVVYSGENIISPAQKNGILIHSPHSIDELSPGFSAINSGMAVRLDYFGNYRYDENLFLDYIDHDFMEDFNKSGEKAEVVRDVVLRQEFFAATNKDKKAARKRYRIFKKDFLYFVKKHGYNKLIAVIVLLKRKLRSI